MSEPDRISCTVTDGVADVRLNRPDKLNALDPEMFRALVDTGLRLSEDSRVRAVVLSGEGRAFCAGLDFEALARFSEGSNTEDLVAERAIGPAKARGQQAAWVWAQLPVPVIAALHGVSYGGGLQIALGADIRLIAPDARMSVMEIKWGIVPDMTGTQLLPELVGRDLAKELTFTGRVVEGEEAAKTGLATRVEQNPRAAAMALAEEIAGKNPEAVREAKRLLDLAGRVDLDAGFAAEQDSIRALFGTPNQVEAVTANLEKRDPEFTDPA
ncbi:crotonase/enoyl-CoA hydratase family protein [Saccharopolyspora griseoalba]|uniref:Crotonase/enoyl-CoA hydratase family protein n=1 Tax=Saccharopolyspora griseoalba TaxID=1431848 RepID=A0ABW2LC46_9PSEU